MSVIALKFFRDTNRYTQDFVADFLNISQPAYSKLESGGIKVSEDIAELLGNLYSVDKRVFTSEEGAVINYNIGTQHSGIIKAENYYESDNKSFEEIEKKLETFFITITNQYNLLVKDLMAEIIKIKT